MDRLKQAIRKNKNLQMLVFRQTGQLESVNRERLELLQTINALEAKLKQIETGEESQEHERRLAQMRQKFRNLERVFTKEKDDGLRLRRENEQMAKVLRKGGLTRVRRLPLDARAGAAQTGRDLRNGFEAEGGAEVSARTERAFAGTRRVQVDQGELEFHEQGGQVPDDPKHPFIQKVVVTGRSKEAKERRLKEVLELRATNERLVSLTRRARRRSSSSA